MQQSKVSTLFQHLRGENAPVEDEADAAVLTRSQRKPLNQISTVQSWLLGGWVSSSQTHLCAGTVQHLQVPLVR